jgi:hypothetical protein
MRVHKPGRERMPQFAPSNMRTVKLVHSVVESTCPPIGILGSDYLDHVVAATTAIRFG